MSADFGPCDSWPITWICDISDASPTVTGSAAAAATWILDAMSGRQFGTCTVTLRPCRRDCVNYPSGYTGGSSMYPMPALIGGQWFNLICGQCGDDCSCTAISEVLLPAPVSSITQVKVDGVILAPTAYRIDDNRRLVRLSGTWPHCNDLNLADTQVGTWSVTAVYGQPVPAIGLLAAGEVACEILRLRADGDCKLPARVQQLVRQGVTLSFEDFKDLTPDGLLGLHLADMFIRAVNPHGLARRSRTYSVDTPPHRRAGT